LRVDVRVDVARASATVRTHTISAVRIEMKSCSEISGYACRRIPP
jgi:hypothetical protein